MFALVSVLPIESAAATNSRLGAKAGFVFSDQRKSCPNDWCFYARLVAAAILHRIIPKLCRSGDACDHPIGWSACGPRYCGSEIGVAGTTRRPVGHRGSPYSPSRSVGCRVSRAGAPSVRRMGTGSSQSRRKAQSQAIHKWRPWATSTGPKTAAGKARVARNAFKGGTRLLFRQTRL